MGDIAIAVIGNGNGWHRTMVENIKMNKFDCLFPMEGSNLRRNAVINISRLVNSVGKEAKLKRSKNGSALPTTVTSARFGREIRGQQQ